MKQLLNSFGDGTISLVEVAKPKVGPNSILIKNKFSAVSVGTERVLVEFGKANIYQKVKQQPDKVKDVINKVKTDGLSTAYNAVKSKLDQPIPLGYSSCGEVIEVGENCHDFKIGDLVISNGSHAEIVSVNKNLVAKIPDGVSLENAAFTVISSIPLQGIRLLDLDIGETVVVTGLGLMGLIASQILLANGCNVIATDFDQKKVDLAHEFGIDAVNVSGEIDIVDYVKSKTNNYGSDKVLITASTKNDEPILQAADMVRKRGKIVLVGVVGLNIDRRPFYEKEITFQVSSSYGPGRYDEMYENKGIDYPYGFVRWTENRNFQAILNLMKTGKLSFNKLITHKYKFEEADQAYNELSGSKNVIGGLFKYNFSEISDSDNVELKKAAVNSNNNVVVGVVGAGNFTNRSMLPKISNEFRLKTIASNRGLSSTIVGQKHNFENSTTDVQKIMEDDEINTVIITTRHDTHYNYVADALNNNKAVYVEKPLALTLDELNKLEGLYNNNHLMVGFNRRFSPHIIEMKKWLKPILSPKSIIMNINAGAIPSSHWTQNYNVGGGRLIGEACHFVDLAKYIANSKIIDYEIISLDDKEENFDTFSIIIKFNDGSIANINYFANGNKEMPKEFIQVNTAGKVMVLDNFKDLKGYGFKDFKKFKTRGQDKGHEKCINEFLKSTNLNEPLIPFDELIEVSRICIELDMKMRSRN